MAPPEAMPQQQSACSSPPVILLDSQSSPPFGVQPLQILLPSPAWEVAAVLPGCAVVHCSCSLVIP